MIISTKHLSEAIRKIALHKCRMLNVEDNLCAIVVWKLFKIAQSASAYLKHICDCCGAVFCFTCILTGKQKILKGNQALIYLLAFPKLHRFSKNINLDAQTAMVLQHTYMPNTRRYVARVQKSPLSEYIRQNSFPNLVIMSSRQVQKAMRLQHLIKLLKRIHISFNQYFLNISS